VVCDVFVCVWCSVFVYVCGVYGFVCVDLCVCGILCVGLCVCVFVCVYVYGACVWCSVMCFYVCI